MAFGTNTSASLAYPKKRAKAVSILFQNVIAVARLLGNCCAVRKRRSGKIAPVKLSRVWQWSARILGSVSILSRSVYPGPKRLS